MLGRALRGEGRQAGPSLGLATVDRTFLAPTATQAPHTHLQRREKGFGQGQEEEEAERGGLAHSSTCQTGGQQADGGSEYILSSPHPRHAFIVALPLTFHCAGVCWAGDSCCRQQTSHRLSLISATNHCAISQPAHLAPRGMKPRGRLPAVRVDLCGGQASARKDWRDVIADNHGDR